MLVTPPPLHTNVLLASCHESISTPWLYLTCSSYALCLHMHLTPAISLLQLHPVLQSCAFCLKVPFVYHLLFNFHYGPSACSSDHFLCHLHSCSFMALSSHSSLFITSCPCLFAYNVLFCLFFLFSFAYCSLCCSGDFHFMYSHFAWFPFTSPLSVSTI